MLNYENIIIVYTYVIPCMYAYVNRCDTEAYCYLTTTKSYRKREVHSALIISLHSVNTVTMKPFHLTYLL